MKKYEPCVGFIEAEKFRISKLNNARLLSDVISLAGNDWEYNPAGGIIFGLLQKELKRRLKEIRFIK